MHKPGYKETNIMKKKKSKKKIIIGAAAVLVVAGGVTVAGQRNSTENQIPQVQVVIAEKGDVEEIVDATGTVGSEEEKTYYSPVNAELKTVSFAQGDVVKKGTKLIPTETPFFKVSGIALKIASRTFVSDMIMNTIPSTNTANNAICQDNPIPCTTV